MADAHAEVPDEKGVAQQLCGCNAELLYWPERRFDLANAGTIVLPQDMRDVAATIWDASVVLAHYVDSLGHAAWRGKRVIELGAGTGLPGIVAARLGASVLLTDLADALHVTRTCAAAAASGGAEAETDGSAQAGGTSVARAPSSSNPSAAGGASRAAGSLSTVPFAWGTALTPLGSALSAARGGARGAGGTTSTAAAEEEAECVADVVLGADIVYNDQYVGQLVQSIVDLLRPGTGGSERDSCDARSACALISYEQRRRDMHLTFFNRLEECGCESVRVRSIMLDAAAQAANVYVYRVALRSR